MPLYICTAPYAPYSPVHLYLLGGFACCGGCNGLPFGLGHFLTPPLYGGASPSFTPQHSVVGSLCISMFLGYQYVIWAFSLLLKGLGVFPHQLGVGASALEMSICSFLYIFVVHYVSHFYYSSDYYSSSYSGIFWPVISVISDSGSFPERVSIELGSAWSGSTTTLHAERLLCHSRKLPL